MSNSWQSAKTNWYGKRNSEGIYSGDYFNVSDAVRLRDNTLILLDRFEALFPDGPVLMDFYPDDTHRMLFDTETARAVISAWAPSYAGYFDAHMIERIITVVRNICHCTDGIKSEFSTEQICLVNREGDYYFLDLDAADSGYLITNTIKPEEYLANVRNVIGSDGLWTDPYYQGYMYNYLELNALEKGMNDLYRSMEYKRQDRYKMLQFMLGVKKGF